MNGASPRKQFADLAQNLLTQHGNRQTVLTQIESAMRQVRNQPVAPSNLDIETHRPLLQNEDALGYIYQSLNSDSLLAAYRGTSREKRKFSAEEIPAVTQLFTPKWVVEYLLENSLGRLWTEWRTSSVHTQPRSIRSLRILDPACGTMNFGVVIIDMLRKMYLEEIRHAGSPGYPPHPACEESEIDACILKENLYGIDIDPIAIDLARRTLEIKVGKPLLPTNVNLKVADALIDCPQIQFDLVVTNPPYLSSRNVDPARLKYLKKHFPTAWRDAYTCFIDAALRMPRPGGRAAILCMQSFMFTAAFEKLRRHITSSAALENIAHFGPGLFDIGNPGTLQTVAFVMRREENEHKRNAQPIVIRRLIDSADKFSALSDPSLKFSITQKELITLPRSAWIYWLPPAGRKIFDSFRPLAQIAAPRQGLATTDNTRFVRYWWEIENPGHTAPRTKWLPYAKGGRFRRWQESPRYRVNWQNEGAEIKQNIIDRYPYLNGKWEWVAKNASFYGRPGITYSYLTSGTFSARLLEQGSFFDVAGSSLFPEDPLPLLGILNSSTARRLLAAISPTVNFQVGDLGQLPVPQTFPDELSADVSRAIDLTRQLDTFDETCPHFTAPEPWNDPAAAHLRKELIEIERRIDQTVAKLYGWPDDSSASNLVQTIDPAELSRRWISYALGSILGRWSPSTTPAFRILDSSFEIEIREWLAHHLGDKSASEIDRAAGGINNFLRRDFAPWHNRLYRMRPAIWVFQKNQQVSFVAHDHASPAVLNEINVDVPKRWTRSIDDGIAINLAPLWNQIADGKLRKILRDLNDDLAAGRHRFAETARAIYPNID